MLLDSDQTEVLRKVDTIITNAGYGIDGSTEYEYSDDNSSQEPIAIEDDRVDYDTGIPMGIREAPSG